MLQQIVVLLIVTGCLAWLGFQAWRFFRPKAGKACGGGCCSGEPNRKSPAAGAPVMMVSSEDLRTRIAARKQNP
jgi:hypothetical protein